MCIYQIQVQISFYWATAKATTEVSECERETLIVFPPAALKASPVNFTYSLAALLPLLRDRLTLGPVSDEVISISFILAPAPLEGTESALNYLSAMFLQEGKGHTTASFAAHLPANDAVGSGAEVQYLISSLVKFRSRKVAEVGTALINSVSTLFDQRTAL